MIDDSTLEATVQEEVSQLIDAVLTEELPGIGGLVSILIGICWPNDQPTVWQQVQAQVQALIAQNILDFDLVDRTEDLSDLQKLINTYIADPKPSGNDVSITAGNDLTDAINKAQDIATHLTNLTVDPSTNQLEDTNTIHLIPLAITVSHLHLMLLLERVSYKTSLYQPPYSPWEDELSAQINTYQSFFQNVFPLWWNWRSTLITGDSQQGPHGGWHNAQWTTYGNANDALNPSLNVSYSEPQGDSDYFAAIVDATKTMMGNRAVATMAGILSSTFRLNIYHPDTKYDPPIIPPDVPGVPSLRSLSLGPICLATLGQDGTGIVQSDASEMPGFVESVTINSDFNDNSHPAFQLHFTDHEGVLGPDWSGGISLSPTPSGTHLTGIEVGFSSYGLLECNRLYYSNGATGWGSGNGTIATVGTDYALVGADYALDPNSNGIQLVTFKYVHASLVNPMLTLPSIFKPAFYLESNGDLHAAFGSNLGQALDQWVAAGLPAQGRRGSHEFDVQYYFATYSDLQTAFGTNYPAGVSHWVNTGLPNEGRQGSREFSVQYYLASYPDLQAAFGTNFEAALSHWMNRGLAIEGRRGSLEFDVQFYLATYVDLKTAFGSNYVAALDHWITLGRAEGRQGAPTT